MIKLSKEQLAELRLSIALGSMDFSDYTNEYWTEEETYYFFDYYIDYLCDKYGCTDMYEVMEVDNIEELWIYANSLYDEAWID